MFVFLMYRSPDTASANQKVEFDDKGVETITKELPFNSYNFKLFDTSNNKV